MDATTTLTAAANRRKSLSSWSNYIPWKGYLDMIAAVDEFINAKTVTRLIWCEAEDFGHACTIDRRTSAMMHMLTDNAGFTSFAAYVRQERVQTA